MDDSLSEASSEGDMTPSMHVNKQNFITESHCMDCTPPKELIIARNPCENMMVMGSHVSVSNQGKVVDDTPTTPALCAETKHILTLNKFCSSDNSDEEESPLAALASRHLKNKGIPSDRCGNLPFSVREEEFGDCKESDNCNKSLKTGGSIPDSAKGQQMYWKLSHDGSVNTKELFQEDTSCVSEDSKLTGDERDGDDSVYSPLVTLADKYLKMEDECETSYDCELEKCGSSSECVQSVLSNLVKQGQNDYQIYNPYGGNSNVLELSSNLSDIGITPITDNFLRPSASQMQKMQEEENWNLKIVKEECISAPQDVRSSGDVRKGVFDCDILANKETSMLDHNQASSLSDLAFHHLSKSGSCRVQSDKQFVPKKFHSDSRISKSVPSGFVIPFLSKSENDSSSEPNAFGEKLMNSSDMQGAVESDVSVESCEEWVIDLTSALRDPELRIPHNTPDNMFSTTIIHIDNTEFQEESVQTTSCHLDASEILKMKFSYSKKRCSPLGRVICRAWRHFSGPYIPRTKQSVETVTHFTFNEPSPDDSILIHLGEKS